MNWRSKIAILLAPILFMIIINEYNRTKVNETPFSSHGITVMNSAIVSPNKCSWNCHNDTQYCKEHHVKLLTSYFDYTDPLYFGIIDLLHSTGNYGLANIIFLVLGIPLIIWHLLIRIIEMHRRIRALK